MEREQTVRRRAVRPSPHRAHRPQQSADSNESAPIEGVSEPERSSTLNVRVTPNAAPQNEPAITVHLLQPRILVAAANDYRTTPTRIGIYRSTDSGRHWTNFVTPLPRGHAASGDPVVVYGYPDLFLVGGAAYTNPDPEQGGGSIIVYRSEDGGATFSKPIIIQEGFDRTSFNDKPWFAIDTARASPFQGRAYVVYTRYMDPGTRVFFHRSEDGGRTWSAPLALSGIDPDSLGTFVAVGQQGEVYVAWMSGHPRTALVCRRSLDGGRTFDPPVTIARFTVPRVEEGLTEFVPEFTFRTFTLAFLGTDTTSGPEGGRVYAVWQQIRQGRRQGRRNRARTVDVMISVSEDNGSTWSRPRKATDTPSDAVSFFPFIAVSPSTGAVNIAYYTNRVVRNRLDVFLARLDRRGRRRHADERVTNVSFDPGADPLGDRFIGDYIGAVALPDGARVAVVWCDTRLETADIFVAPDA